MGAFQNLQNAFLDVIYRYVDNYEDVCRLSKVIAKLLNFEQQLVLDAYEKESLLQKTRLYEAVKADLKGAITKISEDLAALTEQATASVEELMASSEEVKTSFRHSVEKERETITLAQEGIVKVKGLSARIDLINRSSDIMKESVKRLDESSEQIRKIVVIVQEIADQTKLLSLNAAVEAARAGEHGRGFGVVAKEIQKLSDGTMASIKRIADVIAQSSEYTSDVISIIEEVDRQVKAGQTDSDAANAVFDDIREFMSSSMDHMRLVEAELNSLVGVIGEIGSGTIKVAESAEHLHEVTKNI
ncbi:MAG TPA: methyl-accepting chemotaxis protein [Paenibacillus sp.]|uniref:methyl-accepting chemotaxis protein n=1 Tax=Paenibacillus sp. TaxID=58172 RepID=UPI002C1B21E9|nr:methyl-accepting chemotaxis protein [Paenibacillus sp.]HUC92452.1 methyl-accepting chemotaxis protein [Paenibacillus sp.]